HLTFSFLVLLGNSTISGFSSVVLLFYFHYQFFTLVLHIHSFMFNLQAGGVEIKGKVPWEHQSKFWCDADDAQLICYVDAHYGTFSALNYKNAFAKVVDDRKYNPVLERLEV
ncbi:MAG: hypothetical protein FWC91_02575, partial [Defluviitaleaceae bacterium]|nr:hypothetical protein [Defluviitaleaceae bacterium]